jgi:hypothetical protein
MDEQQREGKTSKAFQRAELCFAVLCALGPGTSLNALRQFLASAGFKISRSTLGRYSARFDWERRAAAFHQQATAEAREMLDIDSAGELVRQFRVSRLLTDAGVSALESIESDPERWSKVRLGEAARVAEIGLRSEVQTLHSSQEWLSDVIAALNFAADTAMELLDETDSIEDTAQRRQLFAQGLDRRIREWARLKGIDA